MTLARKITIDFLGTSSEESIPRAGDDCPQCLSTDKKDRRLRSAILVNKKILIDAGPDIMKQLRKKQIENLELVLITHNHDDHSGGIKDLMRLRPGLEIIRLVPGQHFKWTGIDFFAFKVRHSQQITTVGLAIGPIIYIPDSADLDLAQKYLQEAKVAILDGSVLNRNFGGHMSINEIINVTKKLRNLRRIYFTHNGHTHKLHKEMVKIVKALGDDRYSLAYDGLEINFPL